MAKLSDEERLNKTRKDIFLKLSKIFKTCVVTNTGCVWGEDTDEVILQMHSQYIDMIYSFKDNPTRAVLVTSTEAVKKGEFDTITPLELVDIDDSMSWADPSFVPDMLDFHDQHHIRPEVEYEKMNLSDDDIASIFDNNLPLDIKRVIGEEILSVSISRSMLGMTRRSEYTDNVYYKIEPYNEFNEIWRLSIMVEFPYFTMYKTMFFI